MLVVSETEARTTRTAAATMYALAGPSQGSTEVSTWRVEVEADRSSPVHTITHEQVWMPISGALRFTVDGQTDTVAQGQAIIVPGGAVRQVATPDGPAQALVSMRVGGRAQTPGNDAVIPLPWAE